MKRLIILFLVINLFSINNQLSAQEESTGLLGDNFSLEGALDAFKNASSLEDFEKQLNNQDSDVNNLDLNDDGDVDYIRVEEHMEGDVHAIILQALISDEESQDIAVIEVEKTGKESATLQIVGDDYLYGKDHYIEPFDEEATSDGKGGPSADYLVNRIIVNVWLWPSVRHIYRPDYVVYRSPFRWRVYPNVWRPWRPLTWSVYHGKRRHYNHHYHTVKTHRIVRARKIYTPKRKSSKVVVKKSKTVTKVRKSNNGNKTVSKSKTVKKTGKVKANKSKTKSKVKKGKKGKKVKKKKKGN
ncbi:MAG: hypothetical protein ACJA1A_000792 [Saprospiraceae bacterium]|jgi:hypothetical protein|tara:strand:+ start:1946 stop:2842 length:897 start_codon:yes stop_codon:yes gene_type:complete